MTVELAFILVFATLLTTVCAVSQRRSAMRIRWAAVGLVTNAAAAALWLYDIVSFVWNEGVDLYEHFGIIAVVASIFFAVLNAALLSQSSVRARCEATGAECRKPPKLGVLAALAAFEALGLIVMQKVAEFSYRIDYQKDHLYGLLAAAVIVAIHLLAVLCVYGMVRGAGKGAARRAEA